MRRGLCRCCPRPGTFRAAGCVSFQTGAFDAVGDRNPVSERAGCPRPRDGAPPRAGCPCRVRPVVVVGREVRDSAP
ncbi:hypothetical protein HMPREF9058_0649 [Actinomyces sp. oral taxon 175 str. F0384]|nr:hypothetical protein HMPREF9058_0649 [Actinomyces sp. oral taxon 175 str. F0384]